MERILIAEADEKIAWLEKDYLESNGYEARIVARGDKVIPELKRDSYDLLLLDIMLPGISGYDICRQIREEIDIPILMVTARTESVDVIRGLGLGADDYITKPFDPSQLVARVRSHLRRYARLTGKGKEGYADERERILVQDIAIEPKTWKVWKKDKEIRLPNREFELLRFLAENPNIVFSKEELFEKIWGYPDSYRVLKKGRLLELTGREFEILVLFARNPNIAFTRERIFDRVWGMEAVGDMATVTVHINNLREKIEEDPSNPQMIQTIWGVGYRFHPA